MSEDIASMDYEAEIYLLKAEIKRLEERCKKLEADVSNLKCRGNCKKYRYYCNNTFTAHSVCNRHEQDGLTVEGRK